MALEGAVWPARLFEDQDENMRTKRIAVALACLIAAGGIAYADNWPTRPITMIVPFAAGGPTDIVGRIVAQRLSEVLKQQLVVENVGGAGGMTGAQRIAQ